MLPSLIALFLLPAAYSQTYCDDAEECASSFIYTWNSVYCRGFESCMDSWIVTRDSDDGVYCLGEDACYGADITSLSDIYCYGDLSCAYADLDPSSTLICDGNRACQNIPSTIWEINAAGYLSLLNAEITLERRLYVNGALSLFGSTISSQTFSGDQLEIWLRGYLSGFYSTINCNRWTECDLTCYGNSCYQLDFYCNYGATCSYDCGMYGDTDSGVTEYCPNFYDYTAMVEDGTVSNEKEFNQWVLNHKKQRKLEKKIIESFDVIKKIEEGNILSIKEIDKEILIAKNKILEMEEANVNIQDSLNSLHSISPLDTYVYCDDYLECEGETLEADSAVFCRGYEACIESTVENTVNFYSNGYNAQEDGSAEVSNNIYCHGIQGCKDNDLISGNNIYAFGYNGLYDSDVEIGNNLYIHGHYTGVGTMFEIGGNVYAYGMYDFYNGLVYTPRSDETTHTFYIRGLYAGANSVFRCNSGDKCDLQCQGNACYNLDFYCESGANCSYTCGYYGEDSDYDEYCPYYYDYNDMLKNNIISNEQEYENILHTKINELNKKREEHKNTLDILSKSNLILDIDIDMSNSNHEQILNVMNNINNNHNHNNNKHYKKKTFVYQLLTRLHLSTIFISYTTAKLIGAVMICLTILIIICIYTKCQKYFHYFQKIDDNEIDSTFEYEPLL